MTDQTPTTEAGRQVLRALTDEGVYLTLADILAIEAEAREQGASARIDSTAVYAVARADERKRIASAVRGLAGYWPTPDGEMMPDPASAERPETWLDRVAVLAILEG